MTAGDLALLHRWLQEPDTRHWYRFDDLTEAGVLAHYGPCLDGTEPTELWIAQLDGRDAGFLQAYRLADHPEYAELCVAVGADPDAGGIDYLLGEAGDRGHGVGSAMLRAFVEDVCFAEKGWPQVVSGPEPANVRSWRALEKAGFTFLGEIETDDGPERLMQRTRMRG
jgi:aminoglycoside 6'-N-acetyltransferase